jgi:hypothetical protein
MRPMQFPRRFPWLIALVSLPLSGGLFLPLGLWYWLAYPPVQHYYLGAYFEGAFVGDHSTVAVPDALALQDRSGERSARWRWLPTPSPTPPITISICP